MHDCLSGYLNENNLLHRTQSGFRSQHSCETALVHMIDSWLNAMDNGELVGIVLVDFKKPYQSFSEIFTIKQTYFLNLF